MTGRRILVLTARELKVHIVRKDRVVECFAFAATTNGVDGFGRYVAAEPEDPVLLLTNLVEEEFRLETLPHVAPWERRNLHERHAQRLFRSTPFHSSVLLGRQSDGRRDDSVLFSALTNPRLLTPWLDKIVAAEAPLYAISSIPHILKRLPGRFGIAHTHLLLVTDDEEAGIRQSFFCGGVLRTSRLSPPSGRSSSLTHTEWLFEEVARTIRYLHHLQLLPFDAPLHLVVLGADAQLVHLREYRTSANISLHLWNLAETARRLGFAHPGNIEVEGLAVLLFARNRQDCYARSQRCQRSRHRLRRFRGAAGTVAATALLGFAAGNAFEAVVQHRDVEALRSETIRYKRLSQSMAPTSSSSEPSPEQMRNAVDTVHQLSAINTQPRYALARIGAALNAYPEFRIRRIRWSTSLSPQFVESAVQEEAPSSDDGNTRLLHGVVIEGEISQNAAPKGGEAPRRFEAFLNELRRAPDVVRIEVSATPLAGKRVYQGSSTPLNFFAFHVVFRS